jgi:hypothetical protein
MWPVVLMLAAFGGALKILPITQSKRFPPPTNMQHAEATISERARTQYDYLF